ncbi:hypothetical protein GH714_010063 [Hevea brasiliensis]|uniref:Uncharacterized protein n=1 Tax=Hevea brasiliensis TaxID=3981 RepID=A0A6A6M494_HEVBR|nr:hypothetical protein GH714_010063 [Hevea brasiliensis]
MQGEIVSDAQEQRLMGSTDQSQIGASVSQTNESRWVRPPLGTVKFNSDVAMKDGRNFVVIAEVARNHTGKVINGITKKIDCSSALVGEA